MPKYSSRPGDGSPPPVPVMELEIIAIHDGRTASVKGRFLVDSGAYCSMIASDIVSRLNRKLNTPLPYDVRDVGDYLGRLTEHRWYWLEVARGGAIRQGARIEFAELDGNISIAGRDLLSAERILLDGPASHWEHHG